jgi:hypothetical protein
LKIVYRRTSRESDAADGVAAGRKQPQTPSAL